MPQGGDAERGVYLCPPGFYTPMSCAALEVFALCFSVCEGYGCTGVWPGGGSHVLCSRSAGSCDHCLRWGQSGGSGGGWPLSPPLENAPKGMPRPGCVPVADGQGRTGTVQGCRQTGL